MNKYQINKIIFQNNLIIIKFYLDLNFVYNLDNSLKN